MSFVTPYDVMAASAGLLCAEVIMALPSSPDFEWCLGDLLDHGEVGSHTNALLPRLT